MAITVTKVRGRVIRINPRMSLSRMTASGYRVPRYWRRPTLRGQLPPDSRVLWLKGRRPLAA